LKYSNPGLLACIGSAFGLNHQSSNFLSFSSKIQKVIWGGEDIIYSSSEDRLIKLWKPSGEKIADYKGHGH